MEELCLPYLTGLYGKGLAHIFPKTEHSVCTVGVHICDTGPFKNEKPCFSHSKQFVSHIGN